MPSYIPGGSSSGSAVAVAAELVDFALGKLSCALSNGCCLLFILFYHLFYSFVLNLR